jgi:hypothetical protein
MLISSREDHTGKETEEPTDIELPFHQYYVNYVSSMQDIAESSLSSVSSLFLASFSVSISSYRAKTLAFNFLACLCI